MTEVRTDAVRDPFSALAEAEERAAFLAATARQVSGSLDLTQTRRQGPSCPGWPTGHNC